MAKKYYWLKLKNTYFNQLAQKKMRRYENGKEMQIIYLRMMLYSLKNDGYIYYQGVFDSLEEELAEEFDEQVDIVKETIKFLNDNHMITINDESCFMPEALELTGSESDSAERVRKYRKEKLLQCNSDVTECNSEKRRAEKKTEKEKKTETKQEESVSASANRQAGVSLFTLEELKKRCEKNRVNLSEQGIKDFLCEMNDTGWILYQKPVEKENILRVLRAYAKYHPEYALSVELPNSVVGSTKKTPKEVSRDLTETYSRVLERPEVVDGESLPAGVAILCDGSRDYGNVGMPRSEWLTVEEIEKELENDKHEPVAVKYPENPANNGYYDCEEGVEIEL